MRAGRASSTIAADRDPSIRAAVSFAGAADSWPRSAELRERLLAAIGKTNAAIMLTHAENDYDTSAGKTLAEELGRLHKPYVLKIYPQVGLTQDDGRGMLYFGYSRLGDDTFRFLDQHVKQ